MVVFMPPLLQLLGFAFAATLEVRNVDIAVHNQDAGRWSHELIARLDRADFITQVYRVTDGQELGRLIDQGKVIAALDIQPDFSRSEEHTSELQSLMRNSYAVFCLQKKNKLNSMPKHPHYIYKKHVY